ncbi:hypothetical protein WICPIJ_005157 [Wickerhamomyces pijperi]|uniref:Uncharacterized protein n=1 Tax=Wickerhamomyces pijperi TaxID=599730 RepID=A0A9P8Q6N6_WICPI|nr:hypothetical protein WICPIJ_005157 [Wickerhamomyces pijperi]
MGVTAFNQTDQSRESNEQNSKSLDSLTQLAAVKLDAVCNWEIEISAKVKVTQVTLSLLNNFKRQFWNKDWSWEQVFLNKLRLITWNWSWNWIEFSFYEVTELQKLFKVNFLAKVNITELSLLTLSRLLCEGFRIVFFQATLLVV